MCQQDLWNARYRCALFTLLVGLTACGGDDGEKTTADDRDSGTTTPVVVPDTDDTDTTTDTTTDTDVTSETPVAALHPFIGSLVRVSWYQGTPATVHVAYRFEGETWWTTPPQEVEEGPVEQLLLGVPYDTALEYRVVVDDGTSTTTGDTFDFRTGPLPGGAPVPELVSSNPDRTWAEGRFLYTSINASTGGWRGGDYWQLIIDRQGRIVWALKTPGEHWTIWVAVSLDGEDLMFDDSTVWVFPGDGQESKVHRMKIDGTVVSSYVTPGLHHAWVELPGDVITWGAHIDSDEEYLMELAPDGTNTIRWRCSDFEMEQLGELGHDCHSNSWWWEETSDTFLVSFPSSSGDVRDTVLHVDHEGNTLESWGLVSDWSFDPPASTFRYQHGVSFTEDGTLLLSTKLPPENPFYDPSHDTLAVREYELDYEAKVLRQIWSYGDDQGIAGNTAGEAHRLPDGNTLHNYGSGARTREITADGELVWDLKWSGGDTEGSGRLQGRSVLLEDLYDFAP